MKSSYELSEWLRVADLRATHGLNRSKFYRLQKAGLVKTAALKAPGQSRGTVLVNRRSLDQYLESIATGGEDIDPHSKK